MWRLHAQPRTRQSLRAGSLSSLNPHLPNAEEMHSEVGNLSPCSNLRDPTAFSACPPVTNLRNSLSPGPGADSSVQQPPFQKALHLGGS